MKNFITATCCVLGLAASSSSVYAQPESELNGEQIEYSGSTIKIIHPAGSNAELFIRSHKVALGGLGEVTEKDGVMIADLHHPQFNYTSGGGAIFLAKFKLIKPDDEILAGMKTHSEVLLIQSKDKADHWEVVGVELPIPVGFQEGKSDGWLPASFLKKRLEHDVMFGYPKLRYEGFIDENLKDLKNEDPKVRSMAMRMLNDIGPDDLDAVKVIDAIAPFIKSEIEDERNTAIYSISEIGGSHAERYIPLIAELLDSKVKEDRHYAIEAICQIGGAQAQKQLPGIIKVLKDSGYTYNCIYKLGEMGDQAASVVPDLLEHMKESEKKIVDHHDAQYVGNIIAALGKIAPRDPRVIEALTPMTKFKDDHIAWHAKQALSGAIFKGSSTKSGDDSPKVEK